MVNTSLFNDITKNTSGDSLDAPSPVVGTFFPFAHVKVIKKKSNLIFGNTSFVVGKSEIKKTTQNDSFSHHDLSQEDSALLFWEKIKKTSGDKHKEIKVIEKFFKKIHTYYDNLLEGRNIIAPEPVSLRPTSPIITEDTTEVAIHLRRDKPGIIIMRSHKYADRILRKAPSLKHITYTHRTISLSGSNTVLRNTHVTTQASHTKQSPEKNTTRSKKTSAVDTMMNIFEKRYGTDIRAWSGPTVKSVAKKINTTPIARALTWKDTLTDTEKFFLNDVTSLSLEHILTKHVPEYITKENPSSWAAVSTFDIFTVLYEPRIVYGLQNDARKQVCDLIAHIERLSKSAGTHLPVKKEMSVEKYFDAFRRVITHKI